MGLSPCPSIFRSSGYETGEQSSLHSSAPLSTADITGALRRRATVRLNASGWMEFMGQLGVNVHPSIWLRFGTFFRHAALSVKVGVNAFAFPCLSDIRPCNGPPSAFAGRLRDCIDGSRRKDCCNFESLLKRLLQNNQMGDGQRLMPCCCSFHTGKTYLSKEKWRDRFTRLNRAELNIIPGKSFLYLNELGT
ncbi:hypothetical protein H6P81_006502 [Aristolochia fimbriata]|uniref:Uncharacterized protein n=1 Tax=Aristolochia fimbriata TaxID=158543 RepID=A0AAV7EXX3_ARIFI|nr:hypothetical protein H6P81_006502 [Aristolochia fimbriata]